MSQVVYREQYNGARFNLQGERHHPVPFTINGLSDTNARAIINDIFNRERHRLPLTMIIYELGNVFTLTLNAAQSKYSAFVATIPSPSQKGYLRHLLADTRLDDQVAVVDDPLVANDPVYANYMTLFTQAGLQSFQAVAIVLPDRTTGNELDQLRGALEKLKILADSIYYISPTNFSESELPSIEGFTMTKEANIYHYTTPMEHRPEILLVRSQVAQQFYSQHVKRNISSYRRWLADLLGNILSTTDFNQPENQVLRQQLLDHYLSDDSLAVFRQAITASDYSYTRPSDQQRVDYEVYEMLGDRVLESALVHYLKQRFPTITQEELTNLKIYFLSTKQQQQLSLEIGLSKYLISSFKTNLGDIYEDIFEAFTEALKVVGDRRAPGLGSVIAQSFVGYIMDRITIDPSDPEYKSAITRVKELYTQLSQRQPFYEFLGETPMHTINIRYNLKLTPLPPDQLPESFTVNPAQRTITGSGLTMKELKETGFQILWDMLQLNGYKLNREHVRFPRELAQYESSFRAMMRQLNASDYHFRLTPYKGRSAGVSGVVELLINDQWTPIATAIATDLKGCYETLYQYFTIIYQQSTRK